MSNEHSEDIATQQGLPMAPLTTVGSQAALINTMETNTDVSKDVGGCPPTMPYSDPSASRTNSDNVLSAELAVPMEDSVPSDEQYPGKLDEDDEKMQRKKEIEKARHYRRNRQPLLICKFMVEHYKLAFAITLGGHLFLTSLNMWLYLAGYNILPVEFQDFPTDLWDEEVCQRETAWFARDDDPLKVNRFVRDDLVPWWERGLAIDYLFLYYTREGQNLFTRESFLLLEYVEKDMYMVPEYQAIACQLDEDGNCTLPDSIIRFFDGTFSYVDEIFYDPDYQNIPAVLYEAFERPETASALEYFLCVDYVITPEEAFCEITRTKIPLGWPHNNNKTDDENIDMLDKFLLDIYRPVLEDLMDDVEDYLEVVYISLILFANDILVQALKDMCLAIFSLFFIFFFTWFQTQSLWISTWAVFGIFSSFWITNLIYRIVFDYQYFGYFHVISIFIILGIGADDVYVFYDNWRATKRHKYPSLSHRMSDCYRRAAGTMFFTSFTTMMAFLFGALSPILPMDSFGVFSGILIGVNYISVIIFFPTVVMMYHMRYETQPYPCGCCCPCINACKNTSDKAVVVHNDICKQANVQKQMVYNEQHTHLTLNGQNGSITNPATKGHQDDKYVESIMANGDDKIDKVRAEPEEDAPEIRPNVVVRFFTTYYYPFITHKVFKWLILLFFLIFVPFLCLSATRIEVDTEQVKIYKDSHNYGKVMSYASSAFVPTGHQQVVLFIVWGMHPRDYSHCHFSDYNCMGVQVWDDVFDMNIPDSQLAFSDFCYRLKYNLTDEEIERLYIRNNTFTNELLVDCYIDDLEMFLKSEEDRLNDTVDLSLPLRETKMTDYMELNPHIYQDPKTFVNTFYRFYEIALSNWMTNGYRMISTKDYITYNEIIGEIMDDPHTQSPNFHKPIGGDDLAYYGTKLRYAAIRVNLTLSKNELEFSTGLPIMDDWEEFLDAETLVRDAFVGIILGLCVALPVLILATMNWIVGLAAFGIICCIVVSMLGIVPLVGWKIDVNLSMNLTLVVGLSVDYTVHLAEGYHLSPEYRRRGRAYDMLEAVGVSVVSGAITTMGAAVFMLFAQLQFFVQFGAFLFGIIGFSLLYSLVLFTTLIALCGPEGETGSILPPFRFLWRRIQGRDKHADDCDYCEGKGFFNPKVSDEDDNSSESGTSDKEGASPSEEIAQEGVVDDTDTNKDGAHSHPGSTNMADKNVENEGVTHSVYL